MLLSVSTVHSFLFSNSKIKSVKHSERVLVCNKGLVNGSYYYNNIKSFLNLRVSKSYAIISKPYYQNKRNPSKRGGLRGLSSTILKDIKGHALCNVYTVPNLGLRVLPVWFI